ncbi:MAG TPA: hypothetical protein VK709_10080 [Candidatus Saccharimonadales bacterium]|jgi:hypothetical protein|nr:hypothetical protein [Candidatus Saccharimonadales bacterium]
MKRIALFLFGALVVSASALAQTSDPAIETALLAAPASLRDGTTVIKWKADFTYDTLRKGTNRLVCYDRTGLPEQQPFSVECTSIANLDRVAQNLKFEAIGDKAKTQAMLDAAEKDGTRVKPEYGSVWYHMLGPDREHGHIHVTIAVPGATTQSLGLPDNNKQGTVWIMNAGTSTAHLMTPGS